jgi:hypothetical protein
MSTIVSSAMAPRSERLLIAARDARFYSDLSPRVLPEDDDPTELLELEAAREARRQSSALATEREHHAPEGERGGPLPVLKALADEVELQRQNHDAKVSHLVKAALGAAGESDGPIQASEGEPTPVNVISLRIAGFSEEEIAELVQQSGGNAALE